MPTLLLRNVALEPSFYDGMWRVDIDGVHFCGMSIDTLLTAIRARSGVTVYIEPLIEPPLRGPAKHLHVLKTSTSLEDKQDARRRLLAWGGHDHLFNKPLSQPASDLASYHNRDFDDFTVADLTEHVKDIVLRNKLINELAARHDISDRS